MPVIRIAKSIVKRILRRPTDQGAQNSTYTPPPSTAQAPKAASPQHSQNKATEAIEPTPAKSVEPKAEESSEAVAEQTETPEQSELPAEQPEAPPVEEEVAAEAEEVETAEAPPADDANESDHDGATYVFSASGIIPEECPSCGASTHNNWLRDGQDFVCGSCEEPFA